MPQHFAYTLSMITRTIKSTFIRPLCKYIKPIARPVGSHASVSSTVKRNKESYFPIAKRFFIAKKWWVASTVLHHISIIRWVSCFVDKRILNMYAFDLLDNRQQWILLTVFGICVLTFTSDSKIFQTLAIIKLCFNGLRRPTLTCPFLLVSVFVDVFVFGRTRFTFRFYRLGWCSTK